MNIVRFGLVFLFLALSSSTAYSGDLLVGDPYLQPKDPSSHRSLNATVIRVTHDMVFLRTEERTVRNLAMKEVSGAGISSLRPGDKVDLILDRGNSILDITEPGGKGGFSGNEVTGTVQGFDWMNKRVTLETEMDGIRSIELRDAVATKLNGVKKGRVIILELDGKNRVIDAYRPE